MSETASEIKDYFYNVLLARRIRGPVKAQGVALKMARICKDKVSKNVLNRFSTMTMKEFNYSAALLEREFLKGDL